MAPQSPVRRFATFLAELGALTADWLGADHVDLRYVGRLPASEEYIAGAAYIGYGRMDVGHDVPEFFEDLLRAERPQLTSTELERVRKVVGTLLHESIHLALPYDYKPDQGLGLKAAGTVFLEEGVTETTTQAFLPHVLARLEPVFPGVSRKVPDRTRHYPNYVPATRELLSVVSALPEMRGRNAILELARVEPERKFDLLVEQAMEGFGLTYNVPARDREEVRSRIRGALERHVERNHHWMTPRDPDKPAILDTDEPEALSTIMGKQMGMELLRQLHAEGERVQMELPEDWRAMLAEQEFKMAKEMLGTRGFTGPEATSAIQSWVREAQSERHKLRSAAVSRGEEWLRRVAQHHRQTTWRLHEHAGRGLSK